MPRDMELIVFACNWCGYAAGDAAGGAKLPYPTSIRIIRMMCLGMVEPHLILEAFEKGADGVYLMGCHHGDCHYVSGNDSAEAIVERLRGVVQTLGLGKERLQIGASSAGEGQRFAQLLNQFADEVEKMPPSPLKEV